MKRTKEESSVINQGSPNPRPQNNSGGLRLVRNWAAQQEVRGRRASEASSAAPHRLHYRLNHPPNPRPWKNCLPGNWSLVPKRLGTAVINNEENRSSVNLNSFPL